MNFTVACLQINSGADMERNISAALDMAREAHGRGARLLALPENAFLMEEPKAPRRLYVESEHLGVQAFQAFAAEKGCWALIGSVSVKIDDSGKAANRSLLIDAQGRIVARYDKIHLFDVEVGDGQHYAESARIIPGGQAAAADIPWGKLGMTVCYDLRFPQLYRALAQVGADILAVPSAFTHVTGSAHWHVLLRARAIENGCYVIAPAQCGMHPGGRRTYGHSLIVGPWGEVIAEGREDRPEIVMAEIDPEKAREARRRIPSLMHDRAFTTAVPPRSDS